MSTALVASSLRIMSKKQVHCKFVNKGFVNEAFFSNHLTKNNLQIKAPKKQEKHIRNCCKSLTFNNIYKYCLQCRSKKHKTLKCD